MTDSAPLESFLPLRPVEFQVVAILATGPRHGYAILQEAEDRGEGRAVPGLATLYRGLRRLEGEGLIERCDPGDDEDERRRTYALTALGRRVAAAEARRLSGLVDLTRTAGLLAPEDGP
ncbi:MAG TPA: PadR family transcriptional regulator [Longimicrobiales bacterium]|nr:PadR family transcriptional regulator [Longimicrobiales bacterium]